MTPTLDAILALELALQDPAVRASPEAAGALLADGFFEIGSSGWLEERADILARLAREAQEGGFSPPEVTEAALRPLVPGCVALTYRTRRRDAHGGVLREVLRTSVWRLEDGRWRLAFHQGTVVPPRP